MPREQSPRKENTRLALAEMSPFRATLLHSPGWNEGKARYETLGTHKIKSHMSSFRSGTFSASICLGQSSAAPTGLNKYIYNN